MAVYTKFTKDDIKSILSNYLIGDLESCIIFSSDKSSGFASKVISKSDLVLKFLQINSIKEFISLISSNEGVPPPK